MKKISINPDAEFEVEVVPLGGQHELNFYCLGEIRPNKLLIIPDGCKGDTPSYAFICSHSSGGHFIAQISDKMLREGLQKIADLDKLNLVMKP